jgi:hypothetical protein
MAKPAVFTRPVTSAGVRFCSETFCSRASVTPFDQRAEGQALRTASNSALMASP